MKKAFVIFCLLAILLVNNVFAQNSTSVLHTDKNGGFSMYIPGDWRPVNVGLQYLAVVAPEDNGFTPNITIVEEEYTGGISEYIDAVVTMISATGFYADLRVLQQSSFTTNSGLQGGYVLFTARLNEITIRQKMYIIHNRSKTTIMGITGSSGLANGDKYDSVFDECVRTFEWSR